MKIYIVILNDRCDSSICFAFSDQTKASDFAAAQYARGIWYEMDRHEVEVDDESEESA